MFARKFYSSIFAVGCWTIFFFYFFFAIGFSRSDGRREGTIDVPYGLGAYVSNKGHVSSYALVRLEMGLARIGTMGIYFGKMLAGG